MLTGRRMFFLGYPEGVLGARQKNQETFAPWHPCVRTAAAKLKKVFCFFFSKKKTLPFVFLLSACAFPPPLSPTDRATQQECTVEANRQYNAQNRYQLSERNGSDSPFSGGAQAATPSDGLADQYAQENMISDCVRHGGVVTSPSPPPPPPATP